MLMSCDGFEDGVCLSKDKLLRRIFTDDISQKDFLVRPFGHRVIFVSRTRWNDEHVGESATAAHFTASPEDDFHVTSR